MQVNQSSDFITHAAIGAGKVESFQIAQSAEFFQVLSASLYSDKPRALVREVLCNAWDAHIASGCTDLAVEVTLNNNQLIIRDFGAGIAPERMVEIYGTYGQSTKTHDGTQTGGFGLGSKAPFAYTDHFEVVSCHAGIKTIYQLSLSSPDMEGKPAITTILKLPTDETGLQVTIDLKQAHDKYTFSKLIQEIVSYGEMRVSLNGGVLKTIPFSKFKHGFLAALNQNLRSGLYIRYGNVVYAVDRHETFADDYNWAGDIVRQATNNYGGNFSGCVLILQAQPHTIAVTPSRESLSLNDRTLATIKGLLAQFRKTVSAESTRQAVELIQEGIAQAWAKPGSIRNLYDPTPRMLLYPERQREPGFITTPKQLAQLEIINTYDKNVTLRLKDRRARLDALIANGLDKTGLARRYARDGHRHDWFHRKVADPLVRGLIKHPLLDWSRLFTYVQHYELRTSFKPVLKARHFDPYPFVRGIVLLSHNRQDLVDRAPNLSAVKHWFGSVNQSLVYIVQRHKPQLIKAAREFFEQRGYTVLDLTQRYSWDAPLPERAPVVRTRSTGNLSLAGLKDHYDYELSAFDDPEIIKSWSVNDSPEFYVMGFRNSRSGDCLGRWNGCEQTLIELYGDKGVILRTPAQREKMVKAKVPSLPEWLGQQLVKEIKNSPALKRHFANDVESYRVCDQLKKVQAVNNFDLLYAVFAYPAVRAKFGLEVPLTARDQQIISLIDRLEEIEPTQYSSAVESILKKTKISSGLVRLWKAICRNSIKLGCLKLQYYHPINTDRNEATTQLILFALKG